MQRQINTGKGGKLASNEDGGAQVIKDDTKFDPCSSTMKHVYQSKSSDKWVTKVRNIDV